MSFSHKILLSSIIYNFCPFSSATAKYLLFELNIGFVISSVSSFSLFPTLLYIEKLFLLNTPIYLLNAYTFELFSSISILGKLFCVFSFCNIFLSIQFLASLLFIYIADTVIVAIVNIAIIINIIIFFLFMLFLLTFSCSIQKSFINFSYVSFGYILY